MKPIMNRRKASHERWLVSYADFITLLFGLFVVLYAFARADEKKQAQIPVAINEAFRAMGIYLGDSKDNNAIREGKDAPTGIVTSEQLRPPAEIAQDLERIRREMTQALASDIAAHTIAITMGRDGLAISLREAGFFESGSAVPKPETLDTLQRIARSLGREPYDVRVEGHTDNVPIHNAVFDSNWELSAGRATDIARLFLEWNAIPPERLSAAGYGEFHPVADNDTAEGRAENRRVDLLVQPRQSFDFSGPQNSNDRVPWRRVSDSDNVTSQ